MSVSLRKVGDLMYLKAINKLKTEIEDRENIISKIEDFDNLDLVNKFEVLRNSSLKVERDYMPVVLQGCFKSDVLRCGTAEIGVNHFHITCGDYRFLVPTYSSHIITVENVANTLSNSMFPSSRPVVSKRLVDCRAALEDFIKNPTFRLYKTLSKYRVVGGTVVAYIFAKKTVMSSIVDMLEDIKSEIARSEHNIVEYDLKLASDKQIESNNAMFIESISEDLNYFKSRGCTIDCKFQYSFLDL